MTLLLHRDDPYRLVFEAEVRARFEHQGHPAVVLDQTAFYAECGGQPSDTGTLNEARVVAVIEERGEVLHLLDRPLTSQRVRGRVDPERRRDHRQQHHGQHILTRAFVEAASAETIGFHLGGDDITIDLDREISADQAALAESRANHVVWQSLPVRLRTVDRAAAVASGAKVPAGAGALVRLVEIEGFDSQPCSGTHPRSTAEVGCILILGHERYKGGSRVRFVCGDRALLAIRQRIAVLDRLGVVLSSPLAGLVDSAERLGDSLALSEKRNRDLLDRVCSDEAGRLLASASGSPAVVVQLYDGRPPGELRSLAMRLVATGKCVALLASRSEKAHLVFAQSDELALDIPRLLNEAVTFLGGRGGGRGNLAQGGGDHPERIEEALASAAAKARAALGQ